MFDLQRLDDLSLLAESVELECKLAQGQDGKGEVPKDFWPTYSAMANSHGGVVLLGVREKAGVFSVAGIDNAEKVRADLFNTLNNRSKVSANLISDVDVSMPILGGRTVLMVRISSATRKQKPVYINGQPLGNTYRRLHEGDRRCDDETVKRMLAEQLEDSRDTRILNKFGLQDLDMESLHAYRNAFAVHRLGHPWVDVTDIDFLRLIGGWCVDRVSGESGLTAAGLLMFGQWTSISEAFPLYFLDYQERSADPDSQTRWLDRVVPDGSWSGNLYDFFRRVIRKLTADLKVPFVLKGGARIEDTPVHQALREALVNTLIHADYSDRASVLVVKQPAGFVFRNPGMMRVPVEQALHGGASDCRNRTLHQMFLSINLGERAGSGLPKIRAGWEAKGNIMRLFDSCEPFDQTRLEMDWAPASAVLSTETSVKSSPIGSPISSPKTEEKILQQLRENPKCSTQQLGDALGIGKRAVLKQVEKLKQQGRLSRIGSAKGGYWQVLEQKE